MWRRLATPWPGLIWMKFHEVTTVWTSRSWFDAMLLLTAATVDALRRISTDREMALIPMETEVS